MFKVEFLFRSREAGDDDHEEELERVIVFPNIFECLCGLGRCLVSAYGLVAVADFGVVGMLDVTRESPDGKSRARFFVPLRDIGLLQGLAQTHRLADSEEAKKIAVRTGLMRECGVRKDDFSLGFHLGLDAFMKALGLCHETGLELSQAITATARLDEMMSGVLEERG